MFDPYQSQQNHSWRLRVAESQRHLEFDDGVPFFYLADTAWALFQKSNLDEAEYYLENRARKGFTVIQAVLLDHDFLINLPAVGEVPLIENDPLQPNEGYFRHVDAVVEKAQALGLFIGMLPCWGNHWVKRESSQGIFTPENGRGFGFYLGQRYADKPVIWILGGDENIQNTNERATIEAMASGLREGDGGNHLITYHPRGLSRSSAYLHQAEWLDFNMIQSSHTARDMDNGVYIDADYALQPVKPTVDGEPRYEMLTVGFYYKNASKLDRFEAADVRRAAYSSILAGAAGFTYGNNNIWQMWKPGQLGYFDPCVPWWQALDHPGAFQMGYVRSLFEGRLGKLIPDNQIVLDAPASGGAKVRAARAVDGSFALVYSPEGEAFTLRYDVMAGNNLRFSWFDPRYGVSELLYEHFEGNSGFNRFYPPTKGDNADWLLVVE